jgi:hypothetical protein
MKHPGIAPVVSMRDDEGRQAANISSPMAPALPCQMSPEVTQRWRALARQRHAHFVELQQTGRWKHYYSEHDFLVHMREAVHLLDMWNTLTPPAADEKHAGTV